MEEISILQKQYEELSIELESLKTKKRVLLEKMHNLNINIEMKKSKLDSSRRNFFILNSEFRNIQNNLVTFRDKNKKIEDEILLLTEVESNLMNEV